MSFIAIALLLFAVISAFRYHCHTVLVKSKSSLRLTMGAGSKKKRRILYLKI
jgi:hypothetical protein